MDKLCVFRVLAALGFARQKVALLFDAGAGLLDGLVRDKFVVEIVETTQIVGANRHWRKELLEGGEESLPHFAAKLDPYGNWLGTSPAFDSS